MISLRATTSDAAFLRLLRIARLICHVVEGLLATVFLAPFWNANVMARITVNWSLRLLALVNCRVRVFEHAPLQKAHVLRVANHISWLDIFVMNRLGFQRFVAKHEVAGWPILGWLAARGGTLFTERARLKAAYQAGQEVAKRLAGGEVVAVFPETTVTDGLDVSAFNALFLHAASAAACAVQPVALVYRTGSGTRTTLPAYLGEQTLLQNVWQLVCGEAWLVDVHVLPPISAAHRSRRELAALAHQAIRAVVHPVDPRTAN
jgi:1-acyl-sn-glycerol-3-phosphate acyltransferase